MNACSESIVSIARVYKYQKRANFTYEVGQRGVVVENGLQRQPRHGLARHDQLAQVWLLLQNNEEVGKVGEEEN